MKVNLFKLHRLMAKNFWKMLDIVKDYEFIDNVYSFEYKGYEYEYIEGVYCIFIIYIQKLKLKI